MALLLISYQILMLLNAAVIVVGYPERFISSNGLMKQKNLNGMDKRMCLAAACC
jgi:hypothetical protein